ncbi:hypothetical protein Pyn_30570 [Prunus yedoensis var. nudiflora]|uniref:Uncharacterized protein n=1 Tax=Prunus yedoensis var. nudiflora TaxID=2094558 RepID=A0A314YMY1_PRUYE|nr:hypothetical protein Pyn_30570 [Prunus yedoensis var. nudiflora]
MPNSTTTKEEPYQHLGSTFFCYLCSYSSMTRTITTSRAYHKRPRNYSGLGHLSTDKVLRAGCDRAGA